ncbi:Tetratricopeptide repeat protein [Planctomycetes bacterium Pla163]|uniref:Tetratricopeptide repeat protein n=1 Tax=Rohdeia mirabilis TaxID=2528008 RepID=A0A518D188_9BACT|nr:Tetratricopeptide repeat protein [Planctomycetes bacterium Pla163]
MDPNEDIDFDPAVAEDVEERILEQRMEKVQRLLEIGRFAESEREIRGLLADHPYNAELHAALAYVLFQSEKFDDARRAALDALGVDAENVRARIVIAQLHEHSGEHSQAEKTLLEALAIDPMDAEVIFRYALLTYRAGQLDKAQRLSERALAIAPGLVSAHQLLSAIATERHKSGAAHAHSDISLHFAPDEDSSHWAKGHVCLSTGRPFAARRHFREVLRHAPGDQAALEALVEADRCCRLIYLPAYYIGLVLDRVPGGPFVLWGGFLVVSAGMRSLDVPDHVRGFVSFGYLGLCIYTWLARPLVKLWMKIVPTK